MKQAEINRLHCVDEHARMREALRKSREQLRATFEQDAVGIALVALDGRFLRVNRKLCEIVGYTSAELLARNFREITYPEDLDADLACVDRLLAGTISNYTLEKRYIRNDGSLVWVNISVALTRSASGKADSFIGFARDITQQKRVEEAAEKLAAIVESSDDAIISKTFNGIIETWNKGAEKLFGYTAEEAVGQPISILIPQDRQAEEAQILERVSRGDRLDHYETVRVSKDGHLLDVSLTVSPVMDASGKVVGASKVARDITNRKRVENELYESRQMLQQILDTIPQRVFWKDRESTFLGCNKAFANDTGFTNTDGIIGKGNFSLPRREELAKQYRADDLQVMETGVAKIGYEEAQIRPDGTTAWLRTSKIPLRDQQGRIFGVMGTYEDITERKQAENSLKQAKEAAETANRAKDQFIAVLSHELRTPLTPVLAAVTAIEEQKNLSEALRSDIGLIHRNVELEARLIDDLLDVTRISQGKLILRHETVDTHACLNSVLEICESDIESKHLGIDLDLKATQHHVWADSTRLRQVLWNLLNNAVKFTPESGRITLRTFNVDGQLTMQVADTGIGIEPGAMTRIFNAFEQGEQTWTRHFGGLGLGLSIAKALVELHHGSLTAASEGKNKGAVFTVELTTVQPDIKPNGGVQASGKGAPSPLRLLLVEDHPDTLSVLARLLRNWGYGVTTADSVSSALEQAHEQEFDLLISDLGLPDGSGLDVIRELKALHDLPGIALSGYGTDEDIRISLDAGFTEHLTKPVSVKALRAAVTKVTSDLVRAGAR